MDDLIWNHSKYEPWNASDFNRLETWTTYLAAQLRGYGYAVTVATRTWTRTDYPTRGEVDRIRRNVDALQAGFYSLPDWREIVYDNTLGYEQANALEWDLHALYVWLGRMIAHFDFLRSGEIYAGEAW